MTATKPTPEEKLFAVIQGKRHPPLRARVQALPLSSLGAKWLARLGLIDLPRINQALAAIVVVLGILCVVSPILLRPRADRLVTDAAAQSQPFVIASPLAGLPSLDAVLPLLHQQDPFRIEGAAAPLSMPLPAPTPSPQPSMAQAVLADLKLVGISWGAEPVAMVEQGSTQQTHFLKPGDSIGGAIVKEILQDRVIFRVGDEEMDLF